MTGVQAALLFVSGLCYVLSGIRWGNYDHGEGILLLIIGLVCTGCVISLSV